MNNTFDIKRFWNYFLWDLRNAKNNFGLSLIIISCSPLFLYLAFLLLRIVLVGEIGSSIGLPVKVLVAMLAPLCICASFPVKQYGGLTSKKEGSAWLMVPASALEKTISLLLISCLLIPAVFAVLFLIWDLVLGLLPGYGTTLASSIPGYIEEIGQLTQEIKLSIRGDFTAYLSFCEWMLMFTLGSIFFKKSKIAKTILCFFGIVFLLVLIFGSIFGTIHFDLDCFSELNVERIAKTINFIVYALYVVIFALLDAGIYFRIKNLRH